eukprot:3715078-Pyramimonas_sp.AAC.1
MMCTIMGSTKAAVLPEPVLAIPTTSRPASAAGIACGSVPRVQKHEVGMVAIGLRSEYIPSLLA